MTSLNITNARRYLRQFKFQDLFIEELGWDNYHTDLTVVVDDTPYTLQAAAQKRGMVVFVHWSAADIPPANVRNQIERQVAQSHREHFLIFVDGQRTQQKWLWVRREIGRPLARRTHDYAPRQAGDSLIQKLQSIAFSFAEEDDLTLVDVTSRVRAAFNVERATRRFYDSFRKERNAFEKFVQGIPDVDMTKWYVSVMLNRLMFIYFIQRKGFLDGDPDYLRNRLRRMQARYGDDQFYSFYRYFLLRLFHEGLGRPEYDADLEALIGRVPYLNGGIFQEHRVELDYPDIQIPDDVFARIFDFFDQYQWHLDDRPLHDDREINPDVLGYIFEKYINQKQMGAYYTKEDITEYIGKNTIIPFLFDQAQKGCAIAFEGENSVWALAQADPDRYIYEAVRQGTEHSLPPEIAAGIGEVSKRDQWNTPTPDEYALPTEIWRETVARRQRYEEVRAKLANGEVRAINDFITYNLDVQQFAQDVIENCEGPELLRAFWKAITRVSILDPTVGSGAFLFAALNILEPLYEACLERMRAFVAELRPDDHPHKYGDFKQVLARVDQHPNEKYFILKSIVVNNLYGVDIMAEAVEIAKLRLFLKLVAQVERVEEIEPLPDIDFNIRAGNTLVGFTTREEVRRAMESKQVGSGAQQARIVFGEDEAALAAIEEKAADVDRLFTTFRQMQTGGDLAAFDAADFVATKRQLEERLRVLEAELNRHLARQYGVDPDKLKTYQKWLASHQPFHWFIEFYGILKLGGFDVIIGNPPYVQYKKVEKEDYSVIGFKTIEANNLFALVMERSYSLLTKAGRQGMIVPMSIVATQLASSIKNLLLEKSETLFISNYSGDAHPGVLFNGVKMRLSIILGKLATAEDSISTVFCTNFMRWYTEARQHVFDNVFYVPVESHLFLNGLMPKVGHGEELPILEKIQKQRKLLGTYESRRFRYPIYAHRIVAHFVKSFDFIPYFWNEKDGSKKSEDYKVFGFSTRKEALLANAVLNSTTFYYFYLLYSDAYHCGRDLILNFPFDIRSVNDGQAEKLIELNKRLMNDLQTKSVRRKIEYRTGWIKYDEFYPRLSKPLVDEIDRALQGIYGFTDEELDFIINYDIKYRMGDDLFADEDIDDE